MNKFYLDSEKNRYYVGVPFSHGDLNYTVHGATEETFLSLGFTAVTIGEKPDERYYIVGNLNDNGTYTSSPRDLDDVKADAIAECRQEMLSLLSPTDWHVLQAIEDPGLPVTTAISNQRSNIRSACNTREAEINAATSVAQIAALNPVVWSEANY